MSKIKGIDISYWQGNVDFKKVKADGIQFAILREGYGTSVDGKFFDYVKGCKANGIEIKGVYHFSYALNAEQAKQEAIFCIEQMKKAGLGNNCIVFFDFEYDTVNYAKKKGISLGKNECIAFTKAFCEKVTQLGYKAGIYSNIDYYKNMYDASLISKYVFWLAHYTSGTPAYACAFQQYGSTGKVNGINGNVDMDWYFGNAETSSSKKSNSEIAKEVVQGLWGNGEDRKTKLTNAGYNYSEIQKIVNNIVSENKAPAKKSVDEIAKEVINGKWGNGDARKKALTDAGYDYNAVQAKVNSLLSGSSSSKKSIDTIAKEVIQGKWGNGQDRINRLKNAGYDATAVQKKVNEMLSK
ncbi:MULTISPECIES: GH25 family lysozyme [Lachnospiraceae]|jgi:GH25 family lysozyme M1 (1,4-beta-N-acetylmuramidase)|uniref:Cpl-7 lysozyme C-terminal domain-containing protein n=1 Tax=Mediterraneibacter gnavus TaxID=33038 RepID=A0A2N5PMF9_MEDGN|nr:MULTISPECIES: GH25 family lysozyme [Lachnospiraceae]PLT76338.1 hypothetical protein CDL23_04795 [Mediterraneibacter gnavus]